jgi:hypothetical protein
MAGLSNDRGCSVVAARRCRRLRRAKGALLVGKDTHEKSRRRLKGLPFVQLFNYVIDSLAYRALSVAARAALVEVAVSITE